MTVPSDLTFGLEEAEALLKAGWGQGVVLSPNEHVPLPRGFDAWPQDCLLVVCTQSCGVVSPSLERDPWVELAIAIPVPRYSPRSPEATGRHGRNFHVPVDDASFEAVAVDINARFFVPRHVLTRFAPHDTRATSSGIRDLAGWLGRHYTRIALPNELVRRLGPTLFTTLKKYLAETTRPATDGAPVHRVHEAVGSIFVRWTPDTEVGAHEVYEVSLLMLTDDARVADELDERISSLDATEVGVSYDARVQARNETLLSDLDGYVRLTEYDYLTGMAKAAELPIQP